MNKKISVILVTMMLVVFGYLNTFNEKVYAEDKKYLEMNSEITESGTYVVPAAGRIEGAVDSISKVNSNHKYVYCRGSIVGKSYYRIPAGEYYISIAHNGKIKYVQESPSIYEQEDNDSLDTANNIQPNILYTGGLSYSSNSNRGDNNDYYKMNLPQNGSIYVEAPFKDYDYYLRAALYEEDTDGNVKELEKYYYKDLKSAKFRVHKGTIYLKIFVANDGYYYDDYQFKVVYNPDTELSEIEYNNEKTTANLIQPNLNYTGNINYGYNNEYDVDLYKVNLPTVGKAKLRLQVPRQTKNELFKAELLQYDSKDKATVIDTLYSTENPVNYGPEKVLKAGEYYIRVTGSGNKEDSFIDYNIQLEYKTEVLVDKIEVSSPKTEYFTGDEVKLNITVLPENAENKDVSWSSNDEKVVTVDGYGNIICKKAGAAIITARSKSSINVYGEYRLTVKEVLVEQIDVNINNTVLSVGGKTKVMADIYPANADNKSIIWDTSDSSIATVSDKGVVKALKSGKVTIQAMASDTSGIIGTVELTIKKNESVKLKSITVTEKNGKNKEIFEFNSNDSKMVLTLGRDLDVINILPNTVSKKAKFTINGKKVKKIKIKIRRGKTKKVMIKVHSEIGKSKTYTVYVTRD
ncbi:MAG: Ig-like domain-containing protein [Peptoanaerobacter stomatis]